MKVSLLPILLLLYSLIKEAAAITCYECQSSQGQDCKYAASSCAYGFFGCVKIAIYSGGVDKMGMWYNEERQIISMLRGCSIIPFGAEDYCQQMSMFGARVLACYCFNDYCNSASSAIPVLPFVLVLIRILW